VNWIGHFLEPVVAAVGAAEGHGEGHAPVALELGLMGLSVAIALAGIAAAWSIYGRNRGLAGGEAWARRFPALHRLLVHKYFVDELYDATVVKGTWATARGLRRFDERAIDGFGVNGSRNVTVAASLLSGFFDTYVVDGLVNLVGAVLQRGSRWFRQLQTGLVSQYALVMGVGMLVLACFVLIVRWR